mgnify:FL=1
MNCALCNSFIKCIKQLFYAFLVHDMRCLLSRAKLDAILLSLNTVVLNLNQFSRDYPEIKEQGSIFLEAKCMWGGDIKVFGGAYVIQNYMALEVTIKMQGKH